MVLSEAIGGDEKERCELFGEYLLEHRTTVRETAKYFGMSKSTVHKDVTARLKYENPTLYQKVCELLQLNKAERHLRGGEATRRRYAAETEREKEKRNGKRRKQGAEG